MQARETQGEEENLMLKKQISDLRWQYHLERYVGTLTPGSGYAGNQFLSAERVPIPECLIDT